MSMKLARAITDAPSKKRTRAQILALIPAPVYDDGRTKQSFRDECDINLIMDRAAQGGTISHLNKYQGMYGDFSDYDFFTQTQKLTQGREIFDSLPAETRREFGQSPQAFFDYVNDPKNKDDLAKKLPEIAKPGNLLNATRGPDADTQAALDAASEPPANETPPADPPTAP